MINKNRIDNKTNKAKSSVCCQSQKEDLTFDEWQDLMGTNRDTYERVKGRVRRNEIRN